MIFFKIACVKLLFIILSYILVEIISFNLIHETVSVCEEKLCIILIFRLDLVIVEVIHQSLADIEDSHSTIDWLIKHKFFLTQLDCN